MFIDEIKIYARAGHGGRGCVAFHREKFIPKGGPSGGNGGRGGNVILQGDHDLNNLIEQYFNPRLLAQDGGPGLGKGCDGAAGKDLIVRVPCGTMVWQSEPGAGQQAEPDEDQDGRKFVSADGVMAMEFDMNAEAADSEEEAKPAPKGELVADITQHGQQFILCKGGRGGLGNRNFATARRQAPRFAQPGEPGTEGDYLLELRIMAEVGLVGYPNAGKSTLLTAISRARPKIAPYPFTTLHPQIGIVEYPDFHRLTVCDVPGLIEGAHRNVGLGHAFLRHIERCKILVLLLDMAGTDGRTPWDDHAQLLKELALYSEDLAAKPKLVVANKMDEEAAVANLKKFKRRVPKTPVLGISAAFGEGMDKFLSTIRERSAAEK